MIHFDVLRVQVISSLALPQQVQVFHAISCMVLAHGQYLDNGEKHVCYEAAVHMLRSTPDRETCERALRVVAEVFTRASNEDLQIFMNAGWLWSCGVLLKPEDDLRNAALLTHIYLKVNSNRKLGATHPRIVELLGEPFAALCKGFSPADDVAVSAAELEETYEFAFGHVPPWKARKVCTASADVVSCSSFHAPC